MSESEAQRWLTLARHDLAAASRLKEEGHPPWLIRFHAQQAAEKALKAAVIASGSTAARTHDLEALVAVLPHDWKARQSGADLQDLTHAAVEERYPDVAETLTAADAERGLGDARAVVEAVESDLAREEGS